MAKLQLVSPWINFYHELQAFFKYDEDVYVLYDENFESKPEIKLYVNSSEKAGALAKLLPDSRSFGNVELKITVIPSNKPKSEIKNSRYNYRRGRANSDTEALFVKALLSNRAFEFSETVSGVFTNDIVYIVFVNEVVQYYDDNIGDYYGQCSMLFQNLAADIFEPIDGVHYCTNKLKEELF